MGFSNCCCFDSTSRKKLSRHSLKLSEKKEDIKPTFVTPMKPQEFLTALKHRKSLQTSLMSVQSSVVLNPCGDEEVLMYLNSLSKSFGSVHPNSMVLNGLKKVENEAEILFPVDDDVSEIKDTSVYSTRGDDWSVIQDRDQLLRTTILKFMQKEDIRDPGELSRLCYQIESDYKFCDQFKTLYSQNVQAAAQALVEYLEDTHYQYSKKDNAVSQWIEQQRQGSVDESTVEGELEAWGVDMLEKEIWNKMQREVPHSTMDAEELSKKLTTAIKTVRKSALYRELLINHLRLGDVAAALGIVSRLADIAYQAVFYNNISC